MLALTLAKEKKTMTDGNTWKLSRNWDSIPDKMKKILDTEIAKIAELSQVYSPMHTIYLFGTRIQLSGSSGRCVKVEGIFIFMLKAILQLR